MRKWKPLVAIICIGGVMMSSVIAENSVVQIKTSKGDVVVELFDDKAPISVKNFLEYVQEGFYDQTVFHRVISNFMIQGGGMDDGLQPKKTRPPITNEATNRISNKRGTLAMARTYVVDSATAQFFINVVDNPFLDHKSQSTDEYGYAVFGQVIDGMDTVDQIRYVKTGSVGVYNDVPKEPIKIVGASIIKRGSQAPAPTDASTTDAPVKAAPTTTDASTTDAPAKAAPTTTDASTTDAPAKTAPTTTDASTTDAPAKAAPTTTDASTTDAPATDATTTDASTTNEPTKVAPTQ